MPQMVSLDKLGLMWEKPAEVGEAIATFLAK
jgi:hypothetical protein